jgi:hypothetical protein
MEDFFARYWWALIVFAVFLLGAWSNWLAYRRRKDELDLLKSYVQQGKEVPPEVSRAVGGGADPAAGPYGNGGPYGVPPHPYYGWWGWRRYRWGPYWEWRRVFIFGGLSIGFYFASQYAGGDGQSHAFMIVSILTGVIAAASLLFALLQSLMPPPK